LGPQISIGRIPRALSFLSVTEIPDITESEQWTLRTTLKERYGDEAQVQLTDAEIRLSSSDRELADCPVFRWSDVDG